MLEITSIKNGFVLDHIKPGSGVKIFNYLDLGKDENEVALIINAKGSKSYRKDIIKIENATEIDFTVLALLSPGITINEIKDEEIVNKIKPKLPQEIKDIIKCNNQRCITNHESYLEHVFELVNEDNGSYKCQYCDKIVELSEV